MVMTKGQVSIADIALEMDMSVDQVKAWVYDLVGKGLFSGYVNWNDGILYSKQASQIREGGKCPNCGGQLTLAGKGVVTCQYCGTDIFLAQ
jgi:DNA-directed RNA polymerase subunit RPC12/RpoP